MVSSKSGTGKHFKKEAPEQGGEGDRKQVGFSLLAFQALPDLWSFQFVASFVILFPLSLFGGLFNYIASTADATLTSANAVSFLLSWRGPLVLALGFASLMTIMVMELFSQVLLCDDILSGRKMRVFATMGRGFALLRRFLNPVGLLLLAYVLFVAPLCGVGFSVSVTDGLYVPHFVSEVIFSNALYRVAYYVTLLFLAVVGFLNIFAIHGVLIDGLIPREACRQSVLLIRKNWPRLVRTMLGVFVAWGLVLFVFYLFCVAVPATYFESRWPEVEGVELFLSSMDDISGMSEAQRALFWYRFGCVFSVLFGKYLVSITALLSGSYILLRFTRFYEECLRGERELWPERERRHRYLFKIMNMLLVAVIIALSSVVLTLFFEQTFMTDPPGIVAHRTGGVHAPENSLEGLEVAIQHECLGSETDIQRTKDGHYVINHDDTFRRMAGIDRSPKDMTLEEVRSIALKDTTGSDRTLQVPTLEEMLDITVGNEILFIELKGSTADRQMVDDVVAMCRARDCVDDVVLISLDYDVIKYAEETYPEFATGVLIFVGFGDIASIKCDYVLMEEELATGTRIGNLHMADKKAGVWTVNTEDGLRSFLNSGVDVIITDQIVMAEGIRDELEARSDYKLVEDMFNGAFGV